MAVVKICKGKETRRVSSGAFKNFYQKSGWKVDGDDSYEKTYDDDICENCGYPIDECQCGGGEQTGELTDDELFEIPVDDMSKKQAKRAAEILGLDYKSAGISSAKGLKELIKDELSRR